MSIQVLKPKYEIEECLAEIRECLEIGWTGMGFKTNKFEEDWKAYCNLPFAHYINSATAGLHLAVRIFKHQYQWEDGDEIITTPMTFVSTNHAILYEHMKPVFADVDDSLCLDPVDVVRKITPQTRALIYVGVGGNVGQLDEIQKICEQHEIKLILDAAHMGGTKIKGETPGKKADVIVYSFQAVKNLPTSDSGMICFKKELHDTMCRKYTWLGINKDTFSRSSVTKGNYKWKYGVDYAGFKYHGNSVVAAIGIVQLKYLDRDNRKRRQIAQWYDEALATVESVRPIDHNNCESSRHLYQIEVNKRDELLVFLNEHDIYPGVHYRDNTEYDMYAYGKGTCPNAHRLNERILTLPLHLHISKDDVQFVIETILKFDF